MRFLIALLSLIPLVASGAAVGYGKNATGGAGKPTFTVTTLTDSASDGVCGAHCSIRDALAACNAAGGGNIAFTGLSGNLNLGTGGGNLVWNCSNSTIDGSTAANRGVQILGGPWVASSNQFLVAASNVIIRYMRFRCTHYNGNPTNPICTYGSSERDIFAIQSGSNIWVDHCSMAWSTDSNGDIGDGSAAATDITYSNNLFAEPLVGGKSILVASGATRITFYRNAWISGAQRNPAIQPTSVKYSVNSVTVDLVENYWYNFITGVQNTAYVAGLWTKVLLTGNVFQTGPTGDTNEKIPVLYRSDNAGRIWVYIANNYLLNGGFAWSALGASGLQCDVLTRESTNQACTWPTTPTSSCSITANAPCGAIASTPPPATAPASTAPGAPPAFATGWTASASDITAIKTRVLASVGASLPCRDSLDAKVIADANSNGTLGPALPMTAPSGALPTLTTACP